MIATKQISQYATNALSAYTKIEYKVFLDISVLHLLSTPIFISNSLRHANLENKNHSDDIKHTSINKYIC